MQPRHTAIAKELVLIGGGHAHVGVLKRFAMKPVPGLRLTLISRDLHTPYSGMLPGLIAGHYRYDDCHIDLQKLCRFANARLYHCTAEGIDPDNRKIFLPGRPPVHFDTASINIGSTPLQNNIPGAAQHAIAAKPVDIFLQKWQQLQTRFLQHRQDFHLLVIGGGAGGVELALSIHYQLHKLLEHSKQAPQKLKLTLVTESKRIMFNHNSGVQKRMEKIFKDRGIHTLSSTRVISISAEHIETHNGQQIPCHAAILATSASAPQWLQKTSLELDQQGFVKVNPFLQSTSHKNIFAAGDIASLTQPRPKSGVFAVRQGPYLYHNLRAHLLKKPMRPYKPQKNFLGLVSTGNTYAIASRGKLAYGSHWLWKLKDWIDRRFMQQFNQLPEFSEPESDIPPALIRNNQQLQHSIRCAGCGAKVGGDILSRVLDKLPKKHNDHILLDSAGADDAALIKTGNKQLMAQSVDYFRAFIEDNYLFGAIAANHALGDLYAMGAQPHSALAIATLPHATAKIVEQSLYELLSGALSVLHPAGAVLAGGHSSEGLETAFGLSVNGVLEAGHIMQKGKLNQGDILILNKPLGTGVLLAADMRYQARGRWIEQAIDTMLLSNRQASEIFHSFGVQACTDITGFGLAGHLLEMLQASSCSAELYLDRLQFLDGAVACSRQGIESSLFEQNQKYAASLHCNEQLRQHPEYPLVFDPQTAGGLLAAVAADKAQDCLQTLKPLYPQASIIGRVVAQKHNTTEIILETAE